MNGSNLEAEWIYLDGAEEWSVQHSLALSHVEAYYVT